ncbi:MAG: type II toxin-antitoxin system HicA family toxin [Chloroflexota bacterium]
MPKLPHISSRECVRALEKAGFYFVRQKGSHIVMRRDSPFAQTVVPENNEIPVGTLRSILRDADLSTEEFIELL